jgi:hypothetical protein
MHHHTSKHSYHMFHGYCNYFHTKLFLYISIKNTNAREKNESINVPEQLPQSSSHELQVSLTLASYCPSPHLPGFFLWVKKRKRYIKKTHTYHRWLQCNPADKSRNSLPNLYHKCHFHTTLQICLI